MELVLILQRIFCTMMMTKLHCIQQVKFIFLIVNCKKENIGGTQKRKVPNGLFIPLSPKSDQSQFSHNNINT